MIGISSVHPDIFLRKFFLDPKNQLQNVWLVLEFKRFAAQNSQTFIIRLSMRIDSEIYERLNRYCEDSGQTKTLAIERALSVYIDNYYKQQKELDKINHQ